MAKFFNTKVLFMLATVVLAAEALFTHKGTDHSKGKSGSLTGLADSALSGGLGGVSDIGGKITAGIGGSLGGLADIGGSLGGLADIGGKIGAGLGGSLGGVSDIGGKIGAGLGGNLGGVADIGGKIGAGLGGVSDIGGKIGAGIGASLGGGVSGGTGGLLGGKIGTGISGGLGGIASGIGGLTGAADGLLGGKTGGSGGTTNGAQGSKGCCPCDDKLKEFIYKLGLVMRTYGSKELGPEANKMMGNLRDFTLSYLAKEKPEEMAKFSSFLETSAKATGGAIVKAASSSVSAAKGKA